MRTSILNVEACHALPCHCTNLPVYRQRLPVLETYLSLPSAVLDAVCRGYPGAKLSTSTGSVPVVVDPSACLV